MMRDERDKIEQIRARRGRDQVQVGVNPYDPASNVAEANAPEDNILGIDFKSPWLRDRVTLSMDAQIAMIEQRASAAYRTSLADLGYVNRIPILPMRNGVFVKVEPTGCYRVTYHNR